MASAIPVDFTHRFLCRGCIKRESIALRGSDFWVECTAAGLEVAAVLKKHITRFADCPHRGGAANRGLTQMELKLLNRLAVALPKYVNPEDRRQRIIALENEIRMGKHAPTT